MVVLKIPRNPRCFFPLVKMDYYVTQKPTYVCVNLRRINILKSLFISEKYNLSDGKIKHF